MYNIMPSKLMIHQLVQLSLIASLIVGKMVIQSPPELQTYFNKKYPGGDIPFSIANYGVVPYGKTVSGELAIPSYLEDCIYEQLPETSRNKILLVQRTHDRKDCTFTQKSINVQKEGGKLAVIMDDIAENPKQIIMVDDGKGGQVTIPTILIRSSDGNEMLKHVEKGVVMTVTFETIVREKAELQIWIDILNHNNFIFLRNFQAYFDRIKQHVDFSIGYPTSRCEKDCRESECFYNNKYCRYPFRFWGVEDGGKEIIREQLRQWFIFKHDTAQWWTYMLEFDDNCDDLAVYSECSAKVMKSIGIDYDSIMQEVDQSFGTSDNQLLKNMSDYKYNHSILYYPSIVTNSLVYRGNPEPYEVYELICQSLTPIPEGCADYSETDNSHLFFWILLGVGSSFVFIIFLVCCFRRMARRQLTSSMNKQVNELVNQYITMYENDKFREGVEMPQRK